MLGARFVLLVRQPPNELERRRASSDAEAYVAFERPLQCLEHRDPDLGSPNVRVTRCLTFAPAWNPQLGTGIPASQVAF